MFSKGEVKRNLLGCFEILLFMTRGVERFEADKGRMIRSFIIPFSMMPFLLVFAVGMFPDYPAWLVASLTLIRTVVAMVMFFAVVYYMSKQLDRQENFFKYIVVVNWSNINGVILALPILIGLKLGVHADDFEVFAVFLEMAGYVYSGFILTCCLRIPWEMGGFIAIVGLAINQNLWELSDYIRDAAVM